MTGVPRLWRQRQWSNRQAAALIEFALVGVPFGTVIFFVVQIALHLYYQELLDIGLHLAMRQVQTGNAQNVTNGNAFIANYLCPAMGNLVSCADLHVKVQRLTFSGSQDFYNATTGTAPVTGGSLDLSSFASASFCNAGASQFVLISAVYVAPSVLGGFLPNLFSVTYGGSHVDPIFSQTAAYSEDFSTQTGTGSSASAC